MASSSCPVWVQNPRPYVPQWRHSLYQGIQEVRVIYYPVQSKPPLKAAAWALGISSDPAAEKSPILFLQVDPEKWAKREDVNNAWCKLRDMYKQDQNAWDKATWDFLVMTLGRDWSCVGSMSTARKLGWTGYADTWDELEKTFEVWRSRVFCHPWIA